LCVRNVCVCVCVCGVGVGGISDYWAVPVIPKEEMKQEQAAE